MTERQRPVATTIVDVARAAKVSRATASRALAGYGRVRPATREKVLALAAELDYRPNTLARAVRAGRSAVIGLIVTDIANPFLAQLTKAVAGTAVELGYDLLIAETNEDQEAERRATRVFVEKRVDGLIVVPAAGHSHDHLLWATSHGAPLVLLDRSPRRSGLTSVTSDDYRSACEAVELLVGKGHSRIATITATWMGAGFSRRRPAALFSSAAGRVDGFRAGMKRAGLVPRPEWVLYASVAESFGPPGCRRVSPERHQPTHCSAHKQQRCRFGGCHRVQGRRPQNRGRHLARDLRRRRLDTSFRPSHFHRLSTSGEDGGNGGQRARLPDRRSPTLGSHCASEHSGGPAVCEPTAVSVPPPPPVLNGGPLTDSARREPTYRRPLTEGAPCAVQGGVDHRPT